MRRAGRRPFVPESDHSRWLVSYSDFITLLFAFFVVLFASAYRDNHAIPIVSHAIHSGFQEMSATSSAERRNKAPAGSAPTASVAPNMPDNLQAISATSAADVLELQRELEAAIGEELRKHEVILHLTPEGFVISLDEVGFFASGKAILLPGAAGKISRIASVLSRHGLILRIEGHSDNQPIHNTQFDSNWELSTSRAMAVLSLLATNSSFDPARLSIAGYGEYRPVASNDSPEGRSLNRRVDLVVVAPVRHP